MTKALSLASVLLVMLFAGAGARSTAQPDQSTADARSAAGQSPQIQSSSLRIEFEHNMHSRVVARLTGKDVPLGAFSASEIVDGKGRSWADFALE
jgi:hypothetical protein